MTATLAFVLAVTGGFIFGCLAGAAHERREALRATERRTQERLARRMRAVAQRDQATAQAQARVRAGLVERGVLAPLEVEVDLG